MKKRTVILAISLAMLALWGCGGANRYYEKGVTNDDKGEYDEALKSYSKAIEVDPAFIKAYNDRGVIYKNKKSYDEALADFNKAIAVDPSFVKSYINRGNVYLNQKKYDQAIADYTRAIELDAGSAIAYFNRGNCWLGKRLLKKAEEDYGKAAELAPGFYRAHYNRAYIFGLLYDGKNALLHYTKAVQAATASPADSLQLWNHLNENPGNLAVIRGTGEFIDLQNQLKQAAAAPEKVQGKK